MLGTDWIRGRPHALPQSCIHLQASPFTITPCWLWSCCPGPQGQRAVSCSTVLSLTLTESQGFLLVLFPGRQAGCSRPKVCPLSVCVVIKVCKNYTKETISCHLLKTEIAHEVSAKMVIPPRGVETAPEETGPFSGKGEKERSSSKC